MRTLDPEDLLITDGSGPIGLAGVMGGATTEISDTTTDVLIEAANFDPVSIARTAAPAQAAERGLQALRARRRPAGRAAPRPSASSICWSSTAGGTADPLGSVLDAAAAAQRPSTMPLSLPTSLVGVEYTPEQIVVDPRADRRDGRG